ncbi:MAG TPA: aminotransferase class V-fold PLP-dependent enzyme [Bryobacteraceae bacterium]|nr:aminotransferase class V-fold PLP-dependent enzyme [Bryobacteraceae bacterium]
MSASESEKHIYERLGVRPVINARSFSTKVGGAPLPPEVVEAMRAASDCCIRMEDLQEAAGRIIAEVTGAESGIVTSGASAALTLGAAACLTGLDVARMNRLPDTSGMPNEFLVHRTHRNDYDHAIRAAGARFVEVGFYYYTFPYEIEAAVSERTCAFFYQAGVAEGALPLEQFAAIAHRHNLPVIVDAAAELPPPEHLRQFVAQGADLVAFSGGKHIRGPQASGILCGRGDLILSAALQHQDMDVFPETWPHRRLIQDGLLAGPPHHGIGRGFKVGKEEVVGLLTALRRYASRDFEAERQAWLADMQRIVAAVADLPGVAAHVRYPQPDGRQVPHAVVTLDPARTGKTANAVINALQEGDPPVCVFEKLAAAGTIVCMPEALRPGDAERIAQRLTEILRA